MEIANHLILVGGLLFIVSILASILSPRLGVPLLLVFLIVGMLAGEDGPGRIHFGDYHLANLAGTAALAVILFDGGMRTPLQNFRVGLRPALALATIGVLVTTGITGAFAAWVLHLSWIEGLLIGAIVGSTDAAAVFSLLHTNAVHLNQRVTSALEIESGTNDPMAVFLTLGLLQYMLAPLDYSWLEGVVLFVQQMGLGLLFGLGGGWLLTQLLNRLELSDSLYPLLALSGGMLIFGGTALLGGSGFLAAYLAGLMLGNRPLRAFASVRRFHDGIAWLAQIGMFLILGLLATPSRLVPLAIPALLVALVLIFAARPIAVALALAPFSFPWREQAYIAWVGLRGSVPMVLATFPLLAGIAHAQMFFDVAFFIVLVSLVLQGWSVAPVARLLDLQMPQTSARVRRIDLDLPGGAGHEIVSYRISSSSMLVGVKTKQLPIPDVSRLVSVARDGQLLPYRAWGALQAGDYVSLLAAQSELPLLDEVFSARHPTGSADEVRYFGEFAIDPQAHVDALVAAYGLPVPADAGNQTLADFIAVYLTRPVVGDRLRLGEMELIVRKMDGERIVGLGIRLPHEHA
ncbi:MAG: potassium/proton antiporter [Nevskia sp.]|nr:potassium/proton antiporter [Nevskia sp.]